MFALANLLRNIIEMADFANFSWRITLHAKLELSADDGADLARGTTPWVATHHQIFCRLGFSSAAP